MRKVVFKVSSPFVNLTALLIGQLYYPDAYKILLLNGSLYEGYAKKVVELGFADEVIAISHADMHVTHVEQVVEQLLNQHSDIDDYFMNTFSDCYSIVIAYKLLGKAKLHIFPEGSSTVQLEKGLQLILEKSEIYSKDPLRRALFQKYPFDLSIFDYTWMYDLNIPQGHFRAQKRHINIRNLFERADAADVLVRLNQLFRYEPIYDMDICLMDTFAADDDYLDFEAERKILDTLFASLKGTHVLVKPHPPASERLGYTRFKYQKYGVSILENADVPWELIILNLLLRKQKKLTMITLQLDSTYIMTTLSFVPQDFQLRIITLNKLMEPFMREYLHMAYEFRIDYFLQAADKGNVELCMPDNLAELTRVGERISGDKSDCGAEEDIVPNAFFQRVGNLLSKSVLYDNNGQFFAETYFSFLERKSEIIFEVEKKIDVRELIWKPSMCNIFSTISEMNIVITDNLGNKIKYDVNSGASIATEDGIIVSEVNYTGYCRNITITGCLAIYRKFCRVYEEFYEKKWRGDFWEAWYDAVRSEKFLSYIKKRDIKSIWLYGWSKIGIAIAEQLEHYGLEYMFVSSKGGRGFDDGRRDIPIVEACDRYDVPDLMIITPMYAYDVIMHSLPAELSGVAIGLNRFVKELKESG